MRSRIALTGFLCLVSGILFAQKMTVKDSDNHVLMEVNDEGTVGSILLEDSTLAPGTTTNKLYNVSGSLFWNGSALGTSGSAGGWTDGGTDVYTTASTDKVGIGTSSPEFKLSLDDDGGVLAEGTLGSGADLATTGTGTRLIWYPKKAAFRAGGVDGDQWDNANVGIYSVATGYSTTASGYSSTAMGDGSSASGYSSTAMGFSTMASGERSTAMGSASSADGDYSTAMGKGSISSGNYSTAMGFETKAESYGSMAIGRYNVGGGTAESWIATDPLFEIGIGVNALSPANALTVLKNGNVGIGDPTPDYLIDTETDGVGGYYSSDDHQWHNGSSRILKQDIAPNDLDVQGILGGVSIVKYRFKSEVAENTSAPYHVGFIAEDTPEMLTGKDRNSMSTGDCIGLLLAVVKEQQKTIDGQQKRIEALERK